MTNGRKAQIIYTCSLFLWLYSCCNIYIHCGHVADFIFSKIGLISLLGQLIPGTIVLIVLVIWNNNKQTMTTKKKIAIVYITSLAVGFEECALMVFIGYVDLNSYIIFNVAEKLIVGTIIAIVIYRRNKNIIKDSLINTMTTKKKVALIYIISLMVCFRSIYWEFWRFGEVTSGWMLYTAVQYFIQGTIILIVLTAFGVIKKRRMR